MAPALQAKLLRFLEEKAFRRVGGTADVRVDVRVIAATNRDLEEQVTAGKFREDLFYRLNVLRVEIPPLRERVDDVPLLAQHFIETFAREFKRPVRGLEPGGGDCPSAPTGGRATCASCAIWSSAPCCSPKATMLEPHDFDSLHTSHVKDAAPAATGVELPPEGVNLEDVEKTLVMQALERTRGNQTRAAALLGLHRDQIRYRIEKFGLKKADVDA